uniref:Uncharacterized protein n=1 Tax=Sphaerodactylus townsendi TaxID=933632 RepID=A0ACB8FE02_9SAUR
MGSARRRRRRLLLLAWQPVLLLCDHVCLARAACHTTTRKPAVGSGISRRAGGSGCTPSRLAAMEEGSLGTLQQRAAELEHMAEVLLTGEQLR